MSETWGDAEIAALSAHVQHIADENGALRARAERAEAEVARLREALAGHACALECCVCGKTTEEPFLKARCECGESYNGPSLAAVLAALADSEKEET